MLCPIAYHAQKRPSALALALGSETYTYAECDRLIDKIPLLSPMATLRRGEMIQVRTSGSTKAPKIACLTRENHLYSAMGLLTHFPLDPSDRYLLTLPLTHVAGINLLYRTFFAGAAVVLPEANISATHVSLVPTQLLQMKNRHQFAAILLGGAPIDQELVSDNVFTTYGMTEMCSSIMLNGKVLPYREMKVDENGEICVRGKTLFAGYLQDGKLVLPVDKEGWFHTGDLTDGKRIWRKDRMMISGGENIHPEEIERELMEIEGIIEARVEKRKDTKWGERPVAYIKSDRPLQWEALVEKLSEKLPKYKIPDQAYWIS